MPRQLRQSLPEIALLLPASSRLLPASSEGKDRVKEKVAQVSWLEISHVSWHGACTSTSKEGNTSPWSSCKPSVGHRAEALFDVRAHQLLHLAYTAVHDTRQGQHDGRGRNRGREKVRGIFQTFRGHGSRKVRGIFQNFPRSWQSERQGYLSNFSRSWQSAHRAAAA